MTNDRRSAVLGLHHITLVTADAQRNLDFYERVLGLRFLKKTVNFDDPGSYHLYYGDETGSPGTAITFFEWPGAARGASGIGGTHHFALRVADRAGLLKWKRRLADLEVRVVAHWNHGAFESIYFHDPDGTLLEIATDGPGFAAAPGESFVPIDLLRLEEGVVPAETWPEPVAGIDAAMTLRGGMHHLTTMSSDLERTHAFLGDLLGLELVHRGEKSNAPGARHWFWSANGGKPGSLVSCFEEDPKRVRRARFGAGQTHHYALAVADEEIQLEFRERIVAAGVPVSPVMDRIYFRSIYTRDPDGHIVELATAGPGFMVDEPDPARVGRELRLPPWLEPSRREIEAALPPLESAER